MPSQLFWSRLRLLLFVIVLFALARPSLAASQWLNVVQNNGLNQIGQIAYNSNTPQDPRAIAANLVNVFLGFLGTVFLGLVIAAGVMWMTAAGNSDKIDKAKSLLGAGVIGLLIIASAFAISLYVTSRTIYSTEYRITPGGVPEAPSFDIKTNDNYNRLF